jgi:hypothetical protein
LQSERGRDWETVSPLSEMAGLRSLEYSVDLLFTAMDRLVSAFSAPEKKQEPTEPAVKK